MSAIVSYRLKYPSIFFRYLLHKCCTRKTWLISPDALRELTNELLEIWQAVNEGHKKKIYRLRTNGLPEV